ncbi:hypothetical protein OH76DRAFT_1366484 [Lentinus brumalis]|uniref:Uncharacterized protein n=1 Tax=Lentinus brumalis TaxID=2498619 RepID=A0A371CJ17_9APHY|nr:hypothetical protein OH76DRAFT_1366484 [Polyporus brumalis]
MTAKRQKRWTSPVYAFYNPKVGINKVSDKKIGHVFTCAKPGCGQKITRYLDTKDATSTSNLRDHIKACWGLEILRAAEAQKTTSKARPMVEAFGRCILCTSMTI